MFGFSRAEVARILKRVSTRLGAELGDLRADEYQRAKALGDRIAEIHEGAQDRDLYKMKMEMSVCYTEAQALYESVVGAIYPAWPYTILTVLSVPSTWCVKTSPYPLLFHGHLEAVQTIAFKCLFCGTRELDPDADTKRLWSDMERMMSIRRALVDKYEGLSSSPMWNGAAMAEYYTIISLINMIGNIYMRGTGIAGVPQPLVSGERPKTAVFERCIIPAPSKSTEIIIEACTAARDAFNVEFLGSLVDGIPTRENVVDRLTALNKISDQFTHIFRAKDDDSYDSVASWLAVAGFYVQQCEAMLIDFANVQFPGHPLLHGVRSTV